MDEEGRRWERREVRREVGGDMLAAPVYADLEMEGGIEVVDVESSTRFLPHV